MIFWKLPDNKYLAFIPRTGSTAWAQAILDKYYPEAKIKQKRAHVPQGKNPNPQYFVPHERHPTGTLLGILRDPIERFRSGFSRAAKGKNIDELINNLALEGKNIHIRPITKMFEHSDIKWFKYETQLENLAAEIGIELPSIANQSNLSDKPILTEEQINKLKLYYADDLNLYNSLAH